MGHPRLRMICANCRSPRITALGWCEWRTSIQAWEMDEVQNVICDDCACPSNEFISEEIKDV